MATENPYLGCCFEISFDGISMGSFSECSGLSVDINSEDYHEGGNNHFVHKLPTHAAVAPVVLKRGITASRELWTWIRSFLDGLDVKRKTVQVQLRSPGPEGQVLRSWVVEHAYPLKWEGPQLDAGKGEVAFETLELAHHGVWLGS